MSPFLVLILVPALLTGEKFGPQGVPPKPLRQNNPVISSASRHKGPQQNTLNGTGYFGAAPKSASVQPRQLAPATEFSSHLRKLFPAFEFKDLSGKVWKSSELKGKVVYLSIWYSECDLCIHEMPHINALFEALRSQMDVVMLSMAVDDPDQIRKFTSSHEISLPVGQVPSGITDWMLSLNAGIPTHLIIDGEGRLALASHDVSPGFEIALRNSIKASAASGLERR